MRANMTLLSHKGQQLQQRAAAVKAVQAEQVCVLLLFAICEREDYQHKRERAREMASHTLTPDAAL